MSLSFSVDESWALIKANKRWIKRTGMPFLKLITSYKEKMEERYQNVGEVI